MGAIADAYVDLHVSGDHIGSEVKDEIKGIEPAAKRETDKSGDKLGSRFGEGFLEGFKKRLGSGGGGGIGKSLKGAFSGFNPRSLMLPAIAAVVPLITSSLSALTGTLVAFTGAVVQAGGASLSFVGILGTLVQAKVVAGLAFKDFTKAVGGDEEALKALSPAAKVAAKAAQGLTKDWGNLKKAVQEEVFAGLDGVITRIGNKTLPMLQNRLAGTGTVLNGIFKELGRFVTSERFVKSFGKALQGNNRILETLGRAAVPLLDGILAVFRALQPSARRLAGIIAEAAMHFGHWANEAGRAESINDFMKRAFRFAGNLWGILKNLGSVIHSVFGAATPAGGGLLKTLNDLTGRLAKFTALASSKNAIAEWAQKGIEVTGGLFRGLGKIGEVLLPLFNPAIAGGFLSIFEKVVPVIVSVVSVIQSALAPVLKSIGEAFAENGPKFAALFKALAPLLAGIGAVLGQIIVQAITTLGTVAAIITPVVRIISGVLGPILTKFAPIIAGIILAFTNWGGILVKMIPYVGRFLAPLVKLSEWIWRGMGPALKFLGKLFAVVFKAIGLIIGVVGKLYLNAGKIYFEAFGFIVKNVFKGLVEFISAAWRIIRSVFSVAVKVIAAVVKTYFTIYKTIIMTVLRVITTVIKVAWKVISTVVKVAVRLISTVVRAGFNLVKSVVTSVWRVVSSLTSSAWGKISSLVSNGIDKVVGFIKGMPAKIMNLAGIFLSAGKDLGESVIKGLWEGLKAVGGFVGDLASSIKGAINSALNLPITIHGPGPLPDFSIPAFATGTRSAPGGIARVGEHGPENVILPRGSQVQTASQSREMKQRDTGPRKVILRVGARDFVGYIEEIADDRIGAADSLAWQGA